MPALASLLNQKPQGLLGQNQWMLTGNSGTGFNGFIQPGAQLALFNISQLSPQVRQWISTWPKERQIDLFNRAGQIRDTDAFIKFMNASYLGAVAQFAAAVNAASSQWVPPPSGGGGGGGVRVSAAPAGPAPPPAPSAPPPAKNNLPAGATIVYYGWNVWAVYTVAPGVRIAFKVNGELTNFSLAGAWAMKSQAELDRYLDSSAIRGPGAESLGSIAQTHGSFQNYWNYILDITLGKNNPARNDPEVLRVIAIKASRPDMSEAELKRLLQNTEYYQRMTDTQREWNDLSAAEKQYRVNDIAARLANDYFEKVGTTISTKDGNIQHWATQIASGAISYGAVIEQWVKSVALQNPESPWSRLIRQEQEEQRRRGVDIENKTEDVLNLAERWGVALDQNKAREWASNIISNVKSDADFMSFLKEQAAVLYPWKDPEIETAMAAQPWIETFQRTLEKPADITTPEILQALQQGVGLADFQRQLRMRPEWESTRNFQALANEALSEIGRRFGF